MARTSAFCLLGGIFAVSLIALPGSAAQPAQPRAAAPSTAASRALLDQYCTGCHNDRARAANLVLTADKIDPAHVGANAEIWEKVVQKVASGAMPKAGSPRPAALVLQGFVTGLQTALDQASAAAPNPGRPAPHRLNRVEYTNAVRDLLALEIDGRAMLPPDDTGYGFDNIGSVLSLSPGLMERYLLTAHGIARLAVGDPAQHPATETHPVLITARQDDRMNENLPFDSRGGTAFRYNFPLDGQYVVGVRMQHLYSSGRIRGINREEQIEVRLDGKLIKSFDFGGKYATAPRGGRGAAAPGAAPAAATPAAGRGRGGGGGGLNAANPDQARYFFSGDDDLNAQFPAKAGPHIVAVSFVNRATSEPETPYPGRMPVGSIANFSDTEGLMQVDNVQIKAAQTGTAADTPSRKQIFVCHPANEAAEAPCARQILMRLVRLAYRHPATAHDLQPVMDIYAAARKDGDFEAGIETALERILISPEFLFRIERDPARIGPSKTYRLSDLELASRLSFFLWSSIPDDGLLRAAEQNRLRDPKMLEQQVRRMLADRRAGALVTSFGDQWLNVRSTQAVTPDPNSFPEFDDTLRDAMQQETELFLQSQIQGDRPVLELLTADYTFLNQRLAEHYKIPGIYGDGFRRVALAPDNPRRGLLGQGAVLTVTSYPTRTSPVLRGKYILELLGAPPPPPPPNIPALDATPSEVGGRMLSVREQMEAHRKNPVCASCHANMDPLGFALENFDGVGKWRDTGLGGTAIDASASLPDGTKFTGAAALRDLLVSRRQEFITAFTQKLMTYAIGRGTEYYDMPAVRAVMRQAASRDYRWSAIILGIVQSVPFQQRTSQELVTTENVTGRTGQ